MKKISTGKIILFLITNALSIFGHGTIKGSVIDSLTMDQLKGAEIILTNTNFSTVSNIDGEFKISGIPYGEYILQTSYIGYKEKNISVYIKSEKTLELNIELLPNIPNADESILTVQAKSQTEEINLQINSNTIKNVIGGNKLQELPDENISTALNRLPGVSVIYKSFPSLNLGSGSSYLGISENIDADSRIPGDDFPIADDPVSRILIRGMDSKYSNITIDGIKLSPTSTRDKSIDLNIFSERNFQNIELHKTITSDEEADATAGSINMLTGKAANQRIIKVRLLGNDNKLDKSTNQYNFTGSYNERFFGNLLGIQANTKIEKKILSYEYLFDKDPYVNLYPWVLPNLSYTNALNECNGAHVLLDYDTPDGGLIKFNILFNKTNTDYIENNISELGDKYIYSERETEKRVFLSTIGGCNYLFGFDVDWNAAFSESKTSHPFDYSLVFHEGTPGRIANTARYLNHTLDKSSKNYSKENTVLINFNRKYILSNEIAGELKFGWKYRVNSRSYDEESRAENASLWGDNKYRILEDSSLVIKNFTGTRFEGLVGKVSWDIRLPYFQDEPPGAYNIFEYNIPLINKDALRLWRSMNYNDYYVNDGAKINSYNFSQSVFAGYVMHQLNFRQVATFITGLRIESEHNNFAGYYFPYNIVGPVNLYNNIPTKTNTYNYDKITLLPNFQMILKPTDFLNLRLAAYKTLIRPDITTRIPRFITSAANDLVYLNMGAPELKNADVWNYEFQTQFYGNDIGQFSINAFYKDIKGMQQATSGISLFHGKAVTDSLGINWSNMPHNFPYSPSTIFSLYTYFNLPKPTHIWGFEIEHQANFRYLPGLLKNIILNYNFTFLRSETWRFDSFEIIHSISRTGNQYILSYKKLKLSDTPEFFANVNLGYDIKGFSFRISYFYRDGYPIYETKRFKGQIVENKFSRLDIAIKQQILENISIIINLNNITDSKEEAVNNYVSYETTTAQIYRTGMNIDFGIGIDL